MGEGCYITLFSPSDVTAFHRIPVLCTYVVTAVCPYTLIHGTIQNDSVAGVTGRE